MKQSIKDILNGALRFDIAQSLTDDQKVQARANIGAGTSNLTLAGNGSATTAAKSDHTHNYAGSSSAGGAATSANKVNAALTFNNSGNGVASGTTFDGSTARTISYDTIGAAASSHNHDDKYLTGIKMNGASKGTSGVVDLGTVLTDASKFATSAQGTKADNAVPNTRKVNNKALSTDIKLEPSDVGVTESAFPGLKKTGTITGITMNGASKGTSGVVDLGTVLTSSDNLAKLDTENTFTAKQTINSGYGAVSLKTQGYVEISASYASKSDIGG